MNTYKLYRLYTCICVATKYLAYKAVTLLHKLKAVHSLMFIKPTPMLLS